MTRNKLDNFESEPDGFENDKEVQEIRARFRAQEQLIANAFSYLQNALNLIENADYYPVEIRMLNASDLQIKTVYSLTKNSTTLHILCVNYYTEYKNVKGRISWNEDYLIGQLETSNNYPNTYVHRENLKDKILDLFIRCDVDFEESKVFSNRFQVFTDDVEALYPMLQSKSLDQLADFPEMELHFTGKTISFRNSKKPISIEETEEICALSKILLNIF